MLEQLLRAAAHHDAALRAVEQLDRQQILELADPPADGRMVELELLGRRMDGALAGNLQEHPQIVPFDRAANSYDTRPASPAQPDTAWCKKTAECQGRRGYIVENQPFEAGCG